MRLVRRASALGIACLVVAFGLSAVQQPPVMKKTQPLGGGAPIRVEAVSLTVSPENPTAGNQVSITFKIQSLGKGTVARIPWKIHLSTGNRTLARGEQRNVGPGASFEVSALWQAEAGEQRLQGIVDPDGNLPANTASPAKRMVEKVVGVRSPRAAPPAALEERWLDWTEAQMVGAQSSHNVEPGPPCMNTGVFAGKQYIYEFFSANELLGSPEVLESPMFYINCFVNPVGAKASPEAFKNFRLKHGWTIKSVDLFFGTGEWRWETRPQEGSDNPYMKMRIWANAGGHVAAVIRVKIAGPAGTNPYHD